MAKIILVLGGAKAGKSRYACELATKCGKKVAYIATCIPEDEEMRVKIEEHKKKRPADWLTIEETEDLVSALGKIKDIEIIILDCLTLFISNLLLKGRGEGDILKNLKRFIKKVREEKKQAVLVSNEVGMGIVPENRLARQFREIAGRVNQIMAEISDEVYFLIAARPIKIK